MDFRSVTALSFLIICVFILHIKDTWYIIPTAFLSGVGVGTIESNLLNTVSLLDNPDIKVWLIYGFAIGINLTSILGFAALSVNIPLYVIYTVSLLLNVFAIPAYNKIVIYFFFIYFE